MEEKTMGLEKFIEVEDDFLTPVQVSAIIRTFKDLEFEHSSIILSNGEKIIDTKKENYSYIHKNI